MLRAKLHRFYSRSKGGTAITLARVTAQIAQFALFLVAARYLSIAQFGIFSLVFAIALALTRVAEAGWREYMIQSTAGDEKQTHFVAAISGLTLCGIGLLGCGASFEWGTSNAMMATAAMLSLWVFLCTITAVQSGLLNRDGLLGTIGLAQIIGELLGLAAGALAFVGGMGVVALALSKLVAAILTFLISLAGTRWFQFAVPTRSELHPIMSFSRKILASRIINYFQTNGSMLIIGALVGPTGVGLYRAAGRFVGSLADVIGEPARMLAWNALRVARDQNLETAPDFDAMGAMAGRALFLLTLVASPLFVGLALVSDEVILVLLGAKWLAAAPLLSILSIAALFRLPFLLSEPLLALRGRPAMIVKLNLLAMVSNLFLLAIFSHFGIFWVAVSELLGGLLIVPFVIGMQSRFGSLDMMRTGRMVIPVVAATLVLATTVICLRHFGISPTFNAVATMAALVAAGGCVYALTLFCLRRWLQANFHDKPVMDGADL